MAGVGILGPEPVHASGLAEDLRRGQRPAPGDRDQRRGLDGDEAGELSGELVYLCGEFTAAAGQDVCQACDGSLSAGDAGFDLVQGADPVQRSCLGFPVRAGVRAGASAAGR